MRKVRILVDAHVFDHSYQGTTTYISGLYNALVKNDDLEITICASNLEVVQRVFTNDKFKFLQIHSKSKIYRLGIELPKMIRSGSYDYAHFQYIVPFIKRCKYINTIHDLLFLEFPQYFSLSYRILNGTLFRISAAMSDVILTVSEYSKEHINKRFNIPFDQMLVTPNGVSPTSAASKYTSLPKEKYILYVSRYEHRKNHIELLDAFLNLELYRQGYKLVFVGSKNAPIERAAFDRLQQQIPKHLGDEIVFLENLGYDQLNTLYLQSEYFVYPSFAEGFGIPPIEAALYNCKVLCSSVTAMKDFTFFKHRFDPNIESDLVDKLRVLMNDQQYPFQEIRDAVLSVYNWEAISKILYNKLIEVLD